MTELKDKLPKCRLRALSANLPSTSGVHSCGLFGAFTFDDFPNIVDNVELRVSALAWSGSDSRTTTFSSPSSDQQRPLAMPGFGANCFLTGLKPFEAGRTP